MQQKKPTILRFYCLNLIKNIREPVCLIDVNRIQQKTKKQNLKVIF